MNLASAFRFSSSLVVILDAGDGRIVDINPAFERELGYQRADLLGKRSIDIDFWPNLETRATIWAHLHSERRVCGEGVVFRTHAGIDLAAILHCEIFEHDGVSYVFAIFQQVAQASAQDNQVIVDHGSYRALFLAAAEGLYRSLPDSGWIEVNPGSRGRPRR